MAPLRSALVLAGLSMLMLTTTDCKKLLGKGSQDAGPDAPPEPAVEFAGRCINETTGTPYQSIYFFPKKKEMFFYMDSSTAFRSPVTVVREEPRKMEFTFRWSEGDKNEKSLTRSGSVTAVGNKWTFELDTLKGSTCTPSPVPYFYKMLPDLGIPAGKWEEPRTRFGIVVAADAQSWIFKEKSGTTEVHYHVLDQTERSLVVTTYGSTPGDTELEGWKVSRLTRTADGMLHELGDFKVNYKLVAAAPTLQ